MASEPRRRTWMVAGSDPTCDHPRDQLDPIGEDGINAYVRCERCTATFVIRLPDLYAAGATDVADPT